MASSNIQRGFTLIDLAAIVATVSVGASVALIGAQPGAAGETQPDLNESLKKARDTARQLKCSTQLRVLLQSFIIWAQNDQDRYPLPSRFDKEGFTVPGELEAKDTTANVISLLLYNGYLPPEFLISPAEANPRIKPFEGYELDNPKAAVNPEKALWDPAFTVDFTAGKTGHLSYAHLQPFGDRAAKWANTFNAKDVQACNRGPEVASIEAADTGKRTPTPKLTTSVTYAIHGAPDRWEGNIGYADNHINFETEYLVNDPNIWPTYTLKDMKTAAPDCLFFDEQDGKDGSNLFLSIFTKAGKTAEEWKAIWD